MLDGGMGELWYSVSRGEALDGSESGSLVQMSCRDLSWAAL
jgi:hypothetical protein